MERICGGWWFAGCNKHLARTDQPTREKNQHTTYDDLEHRRKERSIHVAFANPCNDGQFCNHDNERNGCCEMKIANQIWHGVPQTAERGHEAADRTANPWCATPAEFAVV